MNPVPTAVRFSHRKYGVPLAVDTSRIPRWTGIVPDGEPHVLDFHEFLVVDSGSADVSLGSRTVKLEPQSILFTPPNVVRRVQVSDPLDLQLVVFSDHALRRSPWSSALAGLPAGPVGVTEGPAWSALGGITALM